MKPGELVTAVTAAVAAVGGWTTAPVGVWYPDFTLAAFKAGGLTAVVIPPDANRLLLTRGRHADCESSCHVAVVNAIDAGTFAEGKAVVDKAQAVAAALLGTRLVSDDAYAHCLEAETAPIISAEYARQHSLWVSYLKLRFKAGVL